VTGCLMSGQTYSATKQKIIGDTLMESVTILLPWDAGHNNPALLDSLFEIQ